MAGGSARVLREDEVRAVRALAVPRGAGQTVAEPPAWGGRPVGVVREGGGVLAATVFPALEARGVVLFGHPGVREGRGWFHVGDRVPFVRELGFTAVVFDFGGFGESDRARALPDVEWADVLRWARRRFPDLDVCVWGVGLGGYFAHHALASVEMGVHAAVFEDVPPDLLARHGLDDEKRVRAEAVLSSGAREWLPAVAHAPHLRAEHVAYLFAGGEGGVLEEDAERLWRAAGPFAAQRRVPGAAPLDAWASGGAPVRHRVGATLLSRAL